MEKHEILYPDTAYTNLILRSGSKELNIFSVDKDGDIEFRLSDVYDSLYFYLDQEGVKLLIEHLQKQLK